MPEKFCSAVWHRGTEQLRQNKRGGVADRFVSIREESLTQCGAGAHRCSSGFPRIIISAGWTCRGSLSLRKRQSGKSRVFIFGWFQFSGNMVRQRRKKDSFWKGWMIFNDSGKRDFPPVLFLRRFSVFFFLFSHFYSTYYVHANSVLSKKLDSGASGACSPRGMRVSFFKIM